MLSGTAGQLGACVIAAVVCSAATVTAQLVAPAPEIEEGRRQLGFHNYDELEAYVNQIGKALP